MGAATGQQESEQPTTSVEVGDDGQVSQSSSIPHRVTDLSQVPEELHPQYFKTGDNSYEFRNATGLKTALDSEKKERRKAQQEAATFKQQLSTVFGDELSEIDFNDVEGVKQRLAQLAAKDGGSKKQSSGDDEDRKQVAIQQALNEQEHEWTRRLKKVENERKSLEEALTSIKEAYKEQVLASEIGQALGMFSLSKSGRELLPYRLRKELVVLESEEQPNSYVVRVKSSDPDEDQIRLTAKGEPMSVADLVERLQGDYPDLFTTTAPPPGSGATGVVTGNGKGLRTNSDGVVMVPSSELSKDPGLYKRLREKGVGFQIV